MSTPQPQTPCPADSPLPAGASTAPVSIHVQRRIAASAKVLFEAWLDPESIARDLQDAREDLRDARTDAERALAERRIIRLEAMQAAATH